MSKKSGLRRFLRRVWVLLLGVAALRMLNTGGMTFLWENTKSSMGQWSLSSRVLAAQLGDIATDAVSAALTDSSPLLAASTIEEAEETAMTEEGLAEVALLEAPAESEATATESTETEVSAEVTESEAEVVQVVAEENPEKTITTASGSSAVSLDGIYLNNSAGADVDLESVAALGQCFTLSDAGEGPQILIMHTHGTEAYTMDGEDIYTASDSYRTTDSNYNTLRVGQEIADTLEALGYSVIHDTSLYDYPSYTGSYSRAREGIQSYLEQYPTISLVLDVHRDALIDDDGTAYKVVTSIDGEKTAQVMLVIGTNLGGLEHPNWTQNLSFGLEVQQALLSIDSTLPRPINLRSSRFNQDLTAGSLLVEVGSCGNTLQEALRGARLFAQALAEALEN
ncbi:MAG: stage II sporulation protein P [Oscillospiraceae bacterium]|nr:stage II sporulation protein P [Oscillospiraceae bacterium]